MAVNLKRERTLDVPTPHPDWVTIFINESGMLCMKDYAGQVIYLIATTVPPLTGAVIEPPVYDAPEDFEPTLPEPVTTVHALPPLSLWDHLKND